MRVWWKPQNPGPTFYHPVAGIVEAHKVMALLADYDLFQFDNKIIFDYANTGGIEILEGGEWVEYEEDET
jgi:hypothetical protein